jgi:hypothetical protein
MAPRTSGSGALSEPIASTTMSIGISLRSLGVQLPLLELGSFLGRNNFAALVHSALLAHTMRQLALVAVRALGGAGGGQEVVAAANGSPSFGVSPFRIRHCGVPFKSSKNLSLQQPGILTNR